MILSRKSLTALVMLLAAIAISGCQPGFDLHDDFSNTSPQPKPEVRASEQIEDSFLVLNTDSEAITLGQSPLISIQKKALEKEFLLMGSLSTQAPVPRFSGLKSRVVAFRKHGSKIYALEATKGHSVSSEIPRDLVLTSFDIIEETDDRITFDFNAGMIKIFTSWDWYTSSSGPTGYNYELQPVPVNHSHIKNAELKNGRLSIHQVAQAELVDRQGQKATTPVAVNYYLSPYQPDPDYIPVNTTDFTTFGYFEVSPVLLEDGSSLVRASRFNPAKPIVFAVSANTPEDFKGAVREGILYWNKAFGQDIIQVVELEDPTITAPNPDYNIVQWVDYDLAGGAYADAQMDPRTGEILHAQVWMSSAFARSGRVAFDNYVRRTEPELPHVGLRGLEEHHDCQVQSHQATRFSAKNLLALNESEDTSLKVARDYVRLIAAHEIGHTLGLRHNFAGNLHANYPLEERDLLFAQYIQDKKAPASVDTTSSVMDYLQFEDAVMSGDRMLDPALPAHRYDELAIKFLYFGEDTDRQEVPPFCTDDHAEQSLGCSRWDTGSAPVEYTFWATEKALELAPHHLLQTFIYAKAPLALSEPARSPGQVKLHPEKEAQPMMLPRWALYKSFTKAGALFQVRRRYPALSPMLEDRVRDEELMELTHTLEALGGLANLVTPIADNFAARSLEKFNELLAMPRYTSGSNNGRPYEFSSDEKAVMKELAKIYFEKLEDTLIKTDLKLLAGNDIEVNLAGKPLTDEKKKELQLYDHDLSFQLADQLKVRMDKYLLATSGEHLRIKIEVPELNHGEEKKPESAESKNSEPVYKTIEVEIPEFAYSQEIRTLAAQLLSSAQSEKPEWGLAERKELAQTLKDLVKEVLQTPYEKVKAERLPRPAARWFLENQVLIKALDS